MLQREVEKKDDAIKMLKNELIKNRKNIKKDIESILTEKMTDLETKTRNMIKEEMDQTKELMKESSQKTYAEITKAHKENLKLVEKQKEEIMKQMFR